MQGQNEKNEQALFAACKRLIETYGRNAVDFHATVARIAQMIRQIEADAEHARELTATVNDDVRAVLNKGFQKADDRVQMVTREIDAVGHGVAGGDDEVNSSEERPKIPVLIDGTEGGRGQWRNTAGMGENGASLT